MAGAPRSQGPVAADARGRLPAPAQLAALGTVLCVHRPGSAAELGGWTRAVHVEVHAGLDGDGVEESLRFFAADGSCCWQLHLLPDSDFLGWSQVSAGLPAVCGDGGAGSVAERLWQGLSRRLRGELWEASVLRFHALRAPAAATADGSTAMLVASLSAISSAGAEVAQRIARRHGGEARFAVDDCCCARAAAASRTAMARDTGPTAYAPIRIGAGPHRRGTGPGDTGGRGDAHARNAASAGPGLRRTVGA
ncbi:Hemin transport protein [Luteimonas sp. BDR2-5]|uniref:Hemin transport protein n=1 Tax=Proluteimonas luteida TaxID=2878685 RepID=UPI001E4E3186|nr:Hemin transport protein [Luteimonas sp. BDR2-5]MCD9027503.1 Hemin transport protein [Luteimonas sp. BDR2-5]